MIHASYLFLVYFHILAMALWLGGMLFFVLTLVPLVRGGKGGAQTGALVHEIAVRFRPIGWLALTTSVVTGVLIVFRRGITLDQLETAAFWASPWGHTLFVKLHLVCLVIVVSLLHDFWIGPRATRRWQEAPDASDTRTLRRAASWAGRINLALALAIVFYGVMLVRGSLG